MKIDTYKFIDLEELTKEMNEYNKKHGLREQPYEQAFLDFHHLGYWPPAYMHIPNTEEDMIDWINEINTQYEQPNYAIFFRDMCHFLIHHCGLMTGEYFFITRKF